MINTRIAKTMKTIKLAIRIIMNIKGVDRVETVLFKIKSLGICHSHTNNIVINVGARKTLHSSI